ncbi:hypothetical protein Tco_0305150 [Tanacetum coccineum]
MSDHRELLELRPNTEILLRMVSRQDKYRLLSGRQRQERADVQHFLRIGKKNHPIVTFPLRPDFEGVTRPEEITAAKWDKYIKFWNDPKNLARAAQNRLNQQKSVVISRQGSRSLARLRDEMGLKHFSLPKDSPATCHWGKVCHRGTNCLTEKRVGPTSSLGIIAGDCIPDEDSPATIPQRHFDGDSFPQRHVAGESPETLLGKTSIVVVAGLSR